MEITLNNNIEVFTGESLTIADIIRIKNFTFRLLVIKVNGKLVKKDERDKVTVKEGDDVLILHLISGG